MITNKYRVIGLMSGTSLDGVDVAYLEFEEFQGRWEFKILKAQTFSYTPQWVEQLRGAMFLDKESLAALDFQYSNFLGELCKDFIAEHDLVKLDAICSHGHTIFHQPDSGYTFQLGNLECIRSWVQVPVVCDFRVQDVALGGQGAPLVPIGDRLLFSAFDACVNLGGFANISFESTSKHRVAFDIVPVNTVLNKVANTLDMEFDANGDLARKGQVCIDLLQELNALGFYLSAYPKSLGIEFVNHVIDPILGRYTIKAEDLLCTFVEHIAIQIARAIPDSVARVLVTGGGAYNDFLLQRITSHAKAEFVVPEPEIIEFKEALIFGFLGVLKLLNRNNVLSSVTGASCDHSSGSVFRC